MLQREMKLGLQLAALHRFDLLDGAECEGCERKEEMNCDCEPDFEECFYTGVFDLYLTACPLRYIPDQVWDFLDEFTFIEYHNSPKDYRATGAAFWMAEKVFRKYLSMAEEAKMKIEAARVKMEQRKERM